jgi:poly(hydroxyalkanoate) depolymerase family esterase
MRSTFEHVTVRAEAGTANSGVCTGAVPSRAHGTMSARCRPIIVALALLLAPLALAQANIRSFMESGGLMRSFIVHLPPGFSTTGAKPLVVALHPMGSSAAQFQSTAGWDSVADQQGVVMVYPDGALSAGSSGGFVWNTWEFSGASPDDVAFLLALISRMQAVYGVDPCRVYMTGFSSGAMMTNSFASVHSDALAAIAPVSGGWIIAYGGSESQLNTPTSIPVWTWRGSDETFTTGDGSSAQPRTEQDQEQLAYWVGHDQATYQSTTVERLTYGVSRIYTTKKYAGKAPVWFTEVQGTGHVYQPGAADLIWTRLFSQTVSPWHGCGPCPADIDGSGAVDGSDIALMLLDFGVCPGCPDDLDGDGKVGSSDLALLLLDFGACPSMAR